MATASGNTDENTTSNSTRNQMTCFVPDDNIAIVIGCSIYDRLREQEGRENMGDLPEALGDIQNVKRGLKRIGVKENEIRCLQNSSRDDL